MGYLEITCIKYNRFDFIKIFKKFKNDFIFDEDYNYYIKNSELIINKINEKNDSEIIYKMIFEYIILPCILLILDNNYNDAYSLLFNSNKLLENIFINKRYIK